MAFLKTRKQRLAEARVQVSADQKFQKEQKVLKKAARPTRRTGFEVGREVARFGQAGKKPIDMSYEQEVMQTMMGGGQKGSIWGSGEQIVNINHDLNAGQRGDTGTAEAFGLNQPRAFQGGSPEVRGMFGL